MRRRYKLSLRTNNFIEETITITITTVTTAVTPYTTITDRNHVALYIIGKDITHRNILRRSKKSLRLSLRISLRTASRNK